MRRILSRFRSDKVVAKIFHNAASPALMPGLFVIDDALLRCGEAQLSTYFSDSNGIEPLVHASNIAAH
ncbi:MAG: hypothetical protein J0H40_05050 [Rhizobiales bacterium]|nr:hypothetical protein [Hyphomicrobiales bacterium]